MRNLWLRMPDDAIVEFMSRSIEVRDSSAATVALVWAVLSDLDNWASWLSTVEGITPVAADDGPEVGAVYRLEQPRLPAANWTVTQWRPSTSFTWLSQRPGVVSVAEHVLTESPGGGTAVTLRMTFTGVLAPLARLLYGRLTRRYLQREARDLCERAEQIAAG